jgi:hypothetical protein
VERVAVEAAEPREAEEPRHDQNSHAAERDRARVEVEGVETRFRPDERLALLRVHAARRYSVLPA